MYIKLFHDPIIVKRYSLQSSPIIGIGLYGLINQIFILYFS